MIVDIILGLLALAGVIFTFVRDRERFREAIKIAGTSLFRLFPAVCLAIFAAALLVPVLPSEIIGHLIGPESGVTGIAIATLAGAFIPGGPFITFPLILIFQSAGAGTAQLVALLTAWSVVAIHRLIAFEVPLMGPRFTGLRLLTSLPLPFLSGLIALLLV